MLRFSSAIARASFSETSPKLPRPNSPRAAVDGEALDPGLAAAAGAGRDEEVESAAVAVSPGAVAGGDGADESGVEGVLRHV